MNGLPRQHCAFYSQAATRRTTVYQPTYLKSCLQLWPAEWYALVAELSDLKPGLLEPLGEKSK